MVFLSFFRDDNISTWSYQPWAVLSENACFFSTSFSLKIVDKMMQSTNLCVILRVKHKNVSFLAVFTWFLILDKIQDGGQDNDHIWWRHRPPAAPSPIKYISFCWEDQRLDLGQNRFEILQLIKNSGEGLHQFPPPPPSCTTVGCDFACTSEG